MPFLDPQTEGLGPVQGRPVGVFVAEHDESQAVHSHHGVVVSARAGLLDDVRPEVSPGSVRHRLLLGFVVADRCPARLRGWARRSSASPREGGEIPQRPGEGGEDEEEPDARPQAGHTERPRSDPTGNPPAEAGRSRFQRFLVSRPRPLAARGPAVVEVPHFRIRS